MARIITVYCEGKRGSHDFDILDKVVGDIATIRPIGGKRGANAIMVFNESNTVRSDFYRFFRDRDFDRPVPENPGLIFDGNKTLFSYRTTIENYLFEPEIFLEFINENHMKSQYGINDISDVKRFFIDAAKVIGWYQAVRHTLGKLRVSNSFETTWVSLGSGSLPDKLDLDSCRNSGWKMVETVVRKNNDELTIDIFNEVLNAFLSKFNEKFYDNLDFLIYFQGKDFAKSLSNRLSCFPMASYYKFAKRHFDYNKFPDLVELNSLVKSEK